MIASFKNNQGFRADTYTDFYWALYLSKNKALLREYDHFAYDQ